jgi:hypothetical protein
MFVIGIAGRRIWLALYLVVSCGLYVTSRPELSTKEFQLVKVSIAKNSFEFL